MEICIGLGVGAVKTFPHIITEPNSLRLGLCLGLGLGLGSVNTPLHRLLAEILRSRLR